MPDLPRNTQGKFDFAADGILVADAATGKISDANPRLAELLGYSLEELRKKKLWELCPEELRGEVQSAFLHPLKNGSIGGGDFWLETKGGRGVAVEFWGQKYAFRKNAFVQCLFKTLPPPKPAGGATLPPEFVFPAGPAAAAPGAEARFLNLFHNLPYGAVVFGAVREGDDFVINDINPEAERIEGVAREKAVGRSVLEVFPGYLDLGIFHGLKHCWLSGSPGHYPASVYANGGQPRWRKCDLFQLSTGQVVCVFEDITESKRAEEEIQQALKEKDLLLKEIHHRVKNNIQILYSLLRLQSAHITDPEVRTQLLSNLGRVRAMSLVQERLHAANSFSRIDFPAYVQNMVVHLQSFHHADPRRIAVGLDMEECLMDIRQAVPLGLIVNELVSNVFRHAFPADRAGHLNIRFRTSGDGSYRLAIKDDGIGVAPEIDFDAPASFGLQIVKTLADQLSGEVRVVRGGGTEVHVTFLKSDPRQIIEEMNYY